MTTAASLKRKDGPLTEAPAAKRKKSGAGTAAGGKEAKELQSVGSVADEYRKTLTTFYKTPSDLLTSNMWEMYLQRSAFEKLTTEFSARIEVSLSSAEETKQPHTKIAELTAMQSCRAVMEKFLGQWMIKLELASAENPGLREIYFRALASVRSRVQDDPDDRKMVRVQFDLDAIAFAYRHEFRIAPPLRHFVNRGQLPVEQFARQFQETTRTLSAETFVIRKSLLKRIDCIQKLGALDSTVQLHVAKWAKDNRAAFDNRRMDKSTFAVAIDTIHKTHPFSKIHEIYVKLDKDLTNAMAETPKAALLVVRKVA